MLITNTENVDKPELKIVASKEGTLAFLSGSVDIDSSPAVRNQLLVLVRSADPKFVSVDLSAVTHLDSSAVATLIEALRVARSSKTELRLRGLQGRLLRLFELTGLLPLFNGSI